MLKITTKENLERDCGNRLPGTWIEQAALIILDG